MNTKDTQATTDSILLNRLLEAREAQKSAKQALALTPQATQLAEAEQKVKAAENALLASGFTSRIYEVEGVEMIAEVIPDAKYEVNKKLSRSQKVALIARLAKDYPDVLQLRLTASECYATWGDGCPLDEITYKANKKLSIRKA